MFLVFRGGCFRVITRGIAASCACVIQRPRSFSRDISRVYAPASPLALHHLTAYSSDMSNVEERAMQVELATLRDELERLQAAHDAQHPVDVTVPGSVAALYRQPKIANFCRENPVMWFVQAEITLRNAGIRNPATKDSRLYRRKIGHGSVTVSPRIIDLGPSPGGHLRANESSFNRDLR